MREGFGECDLIQTLTHSAEIYFTPEEREYEGFINYTKNLPMLSKPSIFGLHDNANINKNQQETNSLLNNIIKTQVSQ